LRLPQELLRERVDQRLVWRVVGISMIALGVLVKILLPGMWTDALAVTIAVVGLELKGTLIAKPAKWVWWIAGISVAALGFWLISLSQWLGFLTLWLGIVMIPGQRTLLDAD
jgi:hypothetical protein